MTPTLLTKIMEAKERQEHLYKLSIEAQEVRPRLFLGGLNVAENSTYLRQLGITHVLSVGESTPTIDTFIDKKQHKTIDVQDYEYVNISAFFCECNDFIRNALAETKTTRVFVHCKSGISRSATILCAYIMASEHKSMKEALSVVVGARPFVCPNDGFEKQLLAYQTTLAPKSSTSLSLD